MASEKGALKKRNHICIKCIFLERVIEERVEEREPLRGLPDYPSPFCILQWYVSKCAHGISFTTVDAVQWGSQINREPNKRSESLWFRFKPRREGCPQEENTSTHKLTEAHLRPVGKSKTSSCNVKVLSSLVCAGARMSSAFTSRSLVETNPKSKGHILNYPQSYVSK